ncbi:MAG: hypothetical protein WA812_07755 [Candidatus Cybelea sp.]
MIFAHITHDQLARDCSAIALAALGIVQLRAPGCFESIWMYFRGAWSGLSNEQSDRLKSVIEARTRAEGAGGTARYAGLFTIAMGLLGLWPAIPYVMPYAASCLAMACATWMAYRRFRHATESRFAPLMHRTPLEALPPVTIVSVALCVIGTAAIASIPQFRVAAALVVVSMAVLVAIAWRIAVAPAVLFGNDPQVEYAVDKRVRFCRATGLVALACAPATVFAALAWAQLPSLSGLLAVMILLVIAGFIATMVVSLNPLREGIALA